MSCCCGATSASTTQSTLQATAAAAPAAAPAQDTAAPQTALAGASGGSALTPAQSVDVASSKAAGLPTPTPAAPQQTPRQAKAPKPKTKSKGTTRHTPKQRSTGQAPKGVLMIGDSLGVGTEPYLKKDLPGTKVTVNAVVGRPLSVGMREYDRIPNSRKPKVVEMGLFTNDSPGNINALKAAVQKTIKDARARGGRVVWSTIHRAAVGGQSYAKVNAYLREMAQKNPDVMGLVDWEKAVTSHPNFLAGDHIHGTTAGYQWRAQAYADAAKG